MPNKKTSYENFSNGAQYGCTYAPFEGLAVLFEIDNLFNRDYRDYAAYGKNPTPRPVNRPS